MLLMGRRPIASISVARQLYAGASNTIASNWATGPQALSLMLGIELHCKAKHCFTKLKLYGPKPFGLVGPKLCFAKQRLLGPILAAIMATGHNASSIAGTSSRCLGRRPST